MTIGHHNNSNSNNNKDNNSNNNNSHSPNLICKAVPDDTLLIRSIDEC